MGKLTRIFAAIFKSPVMQILAPAALTMLAPQLSPLVDLSLRAVLAAEGTIGPGNGVEKARYATQQTSIFAPVLIRQIEVATGRELVDEDLFQAAMQDLNEGVVKLMNAFRILPKEV